jgi:large subunit ribosomal protein L9
VDVILLDDVEKLGLRGEVVAVAPGYARNYLLPRRLAERATPAKVAELRRRDERRARQEARTAEQAQHVAEVLTKTVLRFEVPAGPTGRLFGSVTPTNLADEIWRTRKIRVDRRKISLDEPIKRIGRYQVPVDVFEGVRAEVKTLVVPEGGELPSDEELEAMVAADQAEAAAAAPPEDDGGEEPAELAAAETLTGTEVADDEVEGDGEGEVDVAAESEPAEPAEQV